ncbi:hypothetical protein NC981_18065 [Leptolyngbya sp. DQ-M1]|uniref:hypothetical protein n=1 Tax=Leptolyngbya sp. DQ-M1 TaxID=2933920 RepID=UPI003298807E
MFGFEKRNGVQTQSVSQDDLNMDTLDRISRIVRSETSSRKSQSSHSSNPSMRELQEQAISLRQQIANLEATNKSLMSSALRQESYDRYVI